VVLVIVGYFRPMLMTWGLRRTKFRGVYMYFDLGRIFIHLKLL